MNTTGLDLTKLIALMTNGKGSPITGTADKSAELAMSMLAAGKPQVSDAKAPSFAMGSSGDAQAFLQQYGAQGQLAMQKQQEELNKQKLQGLLQMIGGMR